jgi:hypothetical protein
MFLAQVVTTNGSGREPRIRIKPGNHSGRDCSSEAVTRAFADPKNRQIAQVKGATLVIRNTSALQQIAT